MLTIRRATRSDATNIALLVGRYWEFEEIPGFDAARTEHIVTTFLSLPERGACWVAEGEERIAGYLLAVFMFSLEHGGMMAEIDEFFVLPECRSCGTGAALLAAAEQELGTVGMVRLQLQLGTDNAPARRFYERHGFQERAGYELLDKPLEG